MIDKNLGEPILTTDYGTMIFMSSEAKENFSNSDPNIQNYFVKILARSLCNSIHKISQDFRDGKTS